MFGPSRFPPHMLTCSLPALPLLLPRPCPVAWMCFPSLASGPPDRLVSGPQPYHPVWLLHPLLHALSLLPAPSAVHYASRPYLSSVSLPIVSFIFPSGPLTSCVHASSSICFPCSFSALHIFELTLTLFQQPPFRSQQAFPLFPIGPPLSLLADRVISLTLFVACIVVFSLSHSGHPPWPRLAPPSAAIRSLLLCLPTGLPPSLFLTRPTRPPPSSAWPFVPRSQYRRSSYLRRTPPIPPSGLCASCLICAAVFYTLQPAFTPGL